jgi:hypothetical protein
MTRTGLSDLLSSPRPEGLELKLMFVDLLQPKLKSKGGCPAGAIITLETVYGLVLYFFEGFYLY